ncbi:RNA-directed DNA polymerase, eukaryota, reverse transcriptase zinc-binding domain protein [Tanacetum coccineum]
MSPYLFTLVIKVLTLMVQRRVSKSTQFKFHWGCKELKVTQLCFADDLLMMCNRDYKYVEVLKQGLMKFSKASGLVPNMNKSTIFFGSAKEIEKLKILEIMPFTVGRLQLIASVLATMHIYWASVFLIPKTTVKEIEKALKGFLWCQGELKRGAAKVAWKIICALKSKGGLGIKRLCPWNEALLCKHLWNIIVKKESIWVKWVYTVKLKGRSIWEVDIDVNDSGTWKAILNLRRTMFGNRLGIYEARLTGGLNVANMINNGEWAWHSEWRTKYSWIKDIRISNLEEGKADCNKWKGINGNKKGDFQNGERMWDIDWRKMVDEMASNCKN